MTSKISPLSLAVLTLLFAAALTKPNPTFGVSQTCPRAVFCNAYCTYTQTTGNLLTPRCTTYGAGNTACTACDNTLFVLSGTSCVPHLNND